MVAPACRRERNLVEDPQTRKEGGGLPARSVIMNMRRTLITGARRRWRALIVGGRDPLRLSVQGAAAAGAIYLVMTPLGWPHLSWALISGLFVLQLNSDATRRSLWDRLAGTALGSGVGLAAVALMPGESLAGWRVPAAAFVAMMIAVFKPNRSYVLVAAIAVSLEQVDPVWVGALERTRAIALGALMAVAASWIVWREPARTRALAALSRAIDRCRDLADRLIPAVGRRTTHDDRTALHDDYQQAMALARGRLEDCPRTQRSSMERVAREVDRVWHDLVFVDRLSRRSGSTLEGQERSFDLEGVRAAVCRSLETARDELTAKGRASGDTLPNAAMRLLGDHPPGSLRFVLEELRQDLDGLAHAVGAVRR